MTRIYSLRRRVLALMLGVRLPAPAKRVECLAHRGLCHCPECRTPEYAERERSTMKPPDQIQAGTEVYGCPLPECLWTLGRRRVGHKRERGE